MKPAQNDFGKCFSRIWSELAGLHWFKNYSPCAKRKAMIANIHIDADLSSLWLLVGFAMLALIFFVRR